jgi:polar amino acid transport system ATP-binding protein
MLVIKNLSKSFADKKVLDAVNLSVDRGKIAFLLGSSGVGKSTLLRVLNNLEKPDSGTIELDGKKLDLNRVNQDHTIGMVFQQFNLFDHLTAEQNITLALQKVAKKSSDQAKIIAQQLLSHYGLADKTDVYPGQLSGGQKQRLALARAVALQPKILCLDEPTSALDPSLTGHVARTITELAQEGFIILVASHDVSLLKRLDCAIYLMQQGKIIESAPSQNFEQQPQNYPAIAAFVSGK